MFLPKNYLLMFLVWLYKRAFLFLHVYSHLICEYLIKIKISFTFILLLKKPSGTHKSRTPIFPCKLICTYTKMVSDLTDKKAYFTSHTLTQPPSCSFVQMQNSPPKLPVENLPH